MSLVARPAIAATAVVRMAAMSSAVAAGRATNVLGHPSAVPGCRKNHSSKDKGDHAGERQQQNSDMQPSGLGHPISPLFPRPGRQSDSTMWM